MCADHNSYHSNMNGVSHAPGGSTGYYPQTEADYVPINHPQFIQHQMPPQFANGPEAYIYQQHHPQMVDPNTFGHSHGPYMQTVPPIIHRPANEQQTIRLPTSFSTFPTFIPQQPTYYSQNPPMMPAVPPYVPRQRVPLAKFGGPENSQPSPYPNPQSMTSPPTGSSNQTTQPYEKRKRTPLAIVDPSSRVTVQVDASSSSSTSDKPMPNGTADERSKTLAQASDASRQANQTPSLSSNSTSADTQRQATTIKSSDQSQPAQPGILLTRTSKAEAPVNQAVANGTNDVESAPSEASEPVESGIDQSEPTSDVESQSNDEIQSVSTPTASAVIDESSENVPPSASAEQTSQGSKRLRYSMEELLSKRSAPVTQQRPSNLRFVREIEVEKQKAVYSTEHFLRDVRSILNKLTLQTYDKLVQKLSELELDRPERLEGMINIIFSKAVEEPKFCAMYATLCQDFQKKQVTVPSENGETSTFYFRQLLLSRCQKGFEGDYRQDIDYDRRKIEVDAMPDDKARKEASEDLEEALYKAKQRNFGNILFIGELFKLNLLTEAIMFSCMENLLLEKADEENLECLCRLLRTIGQRFDEKLKDKKTPNHKRLEKIYSELNELVEQKKILIRTRCLIQDVLELRQAGWKPRIVEAKPVKIDQIHGEERAKREQQERERQQQRSEPYRNNQGGNNSGHNYPPQYTGSGSRGSRGSGMKQQSSRAPDRGFNVDSLKQYQSTDKRTSAAPLSFAPQGIWSKPAPTDKKNEVDQNANRSARPVPNSIPSLRPKLNPWMNHPAQRTSPHEVPRDNSVRDENNSSNASVTDSREGSRVVSREQSRNASPDSSLNKESKPSPLTTHQTLDEDKIRDRLTPLCEEYIENYADGKEQPVKDALEELAELCASSSEQQAVVVRELFTTVLDAKAKARKIIGHLLGAAVQKRTISEKGFLDGFGLFVELMPDFVVDIPFGWQYIGETLGAFIGAAESNMSLLKSIFQSIPGDKAQQLFQNILHSAVEFSSRSRMQQSWQSAGLSFGDLLQSSSLDSTFTDEHQWLSATNERPTLSNDPRLVELFKTIRSETSPDAEAKILAYIREHCKPQEKSYIRNIVLAYLEAHLIDGNAEEQLQSFINAPKINILKELIQEQQSPAELEAVYAIQNFVTRLKHPPKMASLLFDKFYDDDCASEEAFMEWRDRPGPSEMEGHATVVLSTNAFYSWLEKAETDDDDQKDK